MEGFKYLYHITNHLCIAPHTTVQLTNFLRVLLEGKKLFKASVSTTGIQNKDTKNPLQHPKSQTKESKCAPKNLSLPNVWLHRTKK